MAMFFFVEDEKRSPDVFCFDCMSVEVICYFTTNEVLLSTLPIKLISLRL